MSGEGGGKIFTPAEIQTPSSSGEQRGGSSDGRAPPVVSFIEAHGSSGNPSIKSTAHGGVQHLVEMNMIWFVIVGLSSLFVLVFVLFVIFMCNRSSSSMRGDSEEKKKNASRVVYERNMRLLKTSSGDGDMSPKEMGALPSSSDEIDAQQQQQLIQQANNSNNGNNKAADIIMQSQHQMITAHISCSNSSSNSTLLKVSPN